MLERLERQTRLTVNQWKIMIAAILGDMLDFFGRPCGIIIGCAAVGLMVLAGYLHSVFVGGVSLFYLLIVAQRFFGDASYAVIRPYSAEIWPAHLRASGMGVGYGTGNIGKVIGPLGLALIVGTSNYQRPHIRGYRCVTGRARHGLGERGWPNGLAVVMRRQLSPRGHHLAARIIRRTERLGYRLDPYLLALVIALAGLNLTCYVAMCALL